MRVRDGTEWVPVPAEQQRLVLAVLLADAGHVVSTERLVDALWGERPPRRATNTVQAYVLRLRGLLGDGVLVTRGHGYELVAGRDDVDAVEFERLVAAARRGEGERCAARLARALALWRGSVLADVPANPVLASRVAHLEQLRLAAQEDRVDALLDLGHHEKVVDELHRLVQEGPLRERRWVQLVTALDRSGRRAEALEAYQRVRRVLLDELDVEPGVALRELQRTILAEPPTAAPTGAPVAEPPAGPAPVVPAQLPADVVAFTGRCGYIGQLDLLLHDAPAAVVISAIAGTAGVGKTALAVHWAHQVRERFADGQLYVNLRGYADSPPVRPIEALARFLRALDVPPEQVPSDVDEASALYRSLLADKRVLVLLDNARDPEQVRPLLPGTKGCLALVTSRDKLGGLVARDGATPLTLDVLTDDEAVTLLARLLGAERIEAEPQAAADVARLCGNLPLALRIAAANLVSRPLTGLAAYLSRLRHDLLGGLDTGDDGVRATFSLSYRAQPAETRRLFRLLGLTLGTDITAPAAAALTGTEPRLAAVWLDRLAAAHLVDEHAAGRYALHDLLRSYAAERAADEEPFSERQAALDRLYEHYQRHADGVADALYPEMVWFPHADRAPIHFADHTSALAWVDTERTNLIAVVVHTAWHGPHQVASRLAHSLRGYFFSRASLVDIEVVAGAGMAAAEADGGAHGLAAGELGLALLNFVRDRHADAIDCYARAAEHARRAVWPQGEAAAEGNMGAEYQILGRLTEAAEHLNRSLAIRRELGWLAGEAVTLDNLGFVYFALGRLELAAEHHTQAIANYRKTGAAPAVATSSSALGEAYHALGRLDDAVATLTATLPVIREAGNRYDLTNTYRKLAEVHRDRGDHATALHFAEEARTSAVEVGNGHLESYALGALAGINLDLGEPEQAVDRLTRAVELARKVDDRYLEVDMLTRLSKAHRAAGRVDPAIPLAEQAVELGRENGYRVLEGLALTALAEVHLDRGDAALAAELAGQAVRIHTETGHRLGRERAQAIADRTH